MTQATLDNLVQLSFVRDTLTARRVSHVVVNAHGQADRKREHHADAAAQLVRVAVLRHTLAIDQNVAGKLRAADEVERAIDRFEESRLS